MNLRQFCIILNKKPLVLQVNPADPVIHVVEVKSSPL